MTLTVEFDEPEAFPIRLAAKAAGCTAKEYLLRLIQEAAAAPSPGPSPVPKPNRIFAIYGGIRHEGEYEPSTGRVDILSGPLAGTYYASSTAAARAVVAQMNPAVNSSRSGPAFWKLDDRSGRDLKSIVR
ncbi:hypothetical protein GCM10009853_026730 [Glycomyces scopariae]